MCRLAGPWLLAHCSLVSDFILVLVCFTIIIILDVSVRHSGICRMECCGQQRLSIYPMNYGSPCCLDDMYLFPSLLNTVVLKCCTVFWIHFKVKILFMEVWKVSEHGQTEQHGCPYVHRDRSHKMRGGTAIEHPHRCHRSCLMRPLTMKLAGQFLLARCGEKRAGLLAFHQSEFTRIAICPSRTRQYQFLMGSKCISSK